MGAGKVGRHGDAEPGIERSAVDALLYGIAEGLKFMKGEGVLLRREMGSHLLEYLIKTGKVKAAPLTSLQVALRRLLEANGFRGERPPRLRGTASSPSAPDLVDYLWESELGGGSHDGTEGAGKPSKVEWPIYEMILYGMTKSLDFLGAQGQMVINRIATEMLNYLVTRGIVTWSEDPMELIQREEAYFVNAGFAIKIGSDVPKPFGGGRLEFTYVWSRYHTKVLKRLRNEGSILYSCPPCIIACSILRDQGWTLRFDVGYRVLDDGSVVLKHLISPPVDTFTEEMVQDAIRESGRDPAQRPLREGSG